MVFVSGRLHPSVDNPRVVAERRGVKTTRDAEASGRHRSPERTRLILAAVLLGIGLGGFVDGIVLHEILQWHHMLSARVAPDDLASLELNTLADGIFHAFTWLVTVAGVFVLMASDGARSQTGGMRTLVGGMLAGWGGFNVVDGITEHYLLNLHHVREGPDQAIYDAVFLVGGAILVAIGVGMVRGVRHPSPTKAD